MKRRFKSEEEEEAFRDKYRKESGDPDLTDEEMDQEIEEQEDPERFYGCPR